MKHRRSVEPGVHHAGSDAMSQNSGHAAAPGLHLEQSASFLRHMAVIGATGAIVIAVMGLLGYMPGLAMLGSVREGYIPMAPSTAISFIVLAAILLCITLVSVSGTRLIFLGALTTLVSLFGLLEVTGYFVGMDLNFEDALVPGAGYLGEIPVARMSYSTGAAFFLAGLALLALLWRHGQSHALDSRLGHFGGSLGSLVLSISLIFCLAYLVGSPLLYGQGTTVPMALTTALAFLMLGGAVVCVSGEAAFPLNLLAATKRTDRRMSARTRILSLIFIMVAACTMVMAVITTVLYQHNLLQQQEMLQVTAQSQARLMEAIARYDKIHSPGAPTEATFSQIIEAHEHYQGFGETGEFTLAYQNGDAIVFILRHRLDSLEFPAPVAFDSELAEPMRRALNGLSGTVVGLDYRGRTVLAAYEPVAVLNLGIVTKLDLAEFRAPFFRSGLVAAAVGSLVILAGTLLFFRIGNPIVAQLEAYSRSLEEEALVQSRLNSELEVKNKALEQVIYVASHDLRSPLVNIDGYSKELLLAIEDLRHKLDNDQIPDEVLSQINPVLNHDLPEALRFIRTSTIKMEALLTGLVELSRSGRAELNIDSLDMNALMSSVIEAFEFQIKEAGARVNFSDLPPCKGDKVQVNQVFSNLLGNALHYLDANRPGVIRISGRVEAQRCVYCVQDNGIGIDPSHQQNIFRIFHRLDPDKSEGEGLGLTIVQQVLGRLAGSVWLQSKPGKGSHFYVALPTGREN